METTDMCEHIQGRDQVRYHHGTTIHWTGRRRRV